MWKLNDVIKIEYLHDRVFRITFDDGLEGEVNFSEYIGRGTVFEPLKDESFFRQASIEGGTIAWPNGADIAPETLYEKIENVDDLGSSEKFMSFLEARSKETGDIPISKVREKHGM
jgi:hypothetical protein